MADTQDPKDPKDTQDPKDDEHLDIDDADAEKLLADAVDESDKDADSETDTAALDKWKKFSRQNEAEAKRLAAKLKEYEDKDKTEAQRLQEAADSFKTRAERAEALHKRREIAEESAPEHATIAQIKAVAKRLSGESDDELEKDAEELFALIAPAPTQTTTPPKNQQPGKPKANLRGGGDPDSGNDETDPAKLAALIPRNR